MTWTIRVLNWREFQHYKDRDPPWIKLHQRKLLDKPEWRRLSGAGAKLLVDVWMLAAGSKEGEVTLPLADLGYRLRMPVVRLARGLRELRTVGLVELSKQMLADAATTQALDAPEGEGETEGEERERTTAEPRVPETTGHIAMANWVRDVGAVWRKAYQGEPPWGKLGKLLLPVKDEPEFLVRFAAYCAETPCRYVNLATFVGGFGSWGNGTKKTPQRFNYTPGHSGPAI